MLRRLYRTCLGRAQVRLHASKSPPCLPMNRFPWQPQIGMSAFSTHAVASQPMDSDDKKGRGWSDPWDMEAAMASQLNLDDMPDWDAKYVSRKSAERVRVHAGIPTLQELIEMKLPVPPPPHPGDGATKAYALARIRALRQSVRELIPAAVGSKLEKIARLKDEDARQDAIDDLFERTERQLAEEQPILSKHPKFGVWVERWLEDYLLSLKRGTTVELTVPESESLPVFVDCADGNDIPAVLAPLQSFERSENRGRLLEEWDLASNKATKRIMLRNSTAKVAQAVMERRPVLVTGKQGVGKTSALAAVVASCRSSGHIVLYLPDGYRLHSQFYSVEPNTHREGLYDLPRLSQSVCRDLLQAHEKQLSKLVVSHDIIKSIMADDQVKRLKLEAPTVADLLRAGADKMSMAANCYSAAMETLSTQKDFDFTIICDEFNCFFQESEYFHTHYDKDVRKPIPHSQVTLLKPLLEASGLDDSTNEPKVMQRGTIVLGMSESRGVSRDLTDTIVASGRTLTSRGTPYLVVEVPRLSSIEMEHMLANYECIGLGKLRLDQGATVLNDLEVRFLHTVSGGIPQKLMDACLI